MERFLESHGKKDFWVLENPGIWSLQVLESPGKKHLNVCTNPGFACVGRFRWYVFYIVINSKQRGLGPTAIVRLCSSRIVVTMRRCTAPPRCHSHLTVCIVIKWHAPPSMSWVVRVISLTTACGRVYLSEMQSVRRCLSCDHRTIAPTSACGNSLSQGLEMLFILG